MGPGAGEIESRTQRGKTILSPHFYPSFCSAFRRNHIHTSPGRSSSFPSSLCLLSNCSYFYSLCLPRLLFQISLIRPLFLLPFGLLLPLLYSACLFLATSKLLRSTQLLLAVSSFDLCVSLFVVLSSFDTPASTPSANAYAAAAASSMCKFSQFASSLAHHFVSHFNVHSGSTFPFNASFVNG